MRQALLAACLLLGAQASAQPVPLVGAVPVVSAPPDMGSTPAVQEGAVPAVSASPDMGATLRLERVAGRVRRAAARYGEHAAGVVADGRIHSLSLLRADLALLQREVFVLDATLASMEAQRAQQGGRSTGLAVEGAPGTP